MPDPLENAPTARPAGRSRWLLVTMILVSVGYAGIFAFAILGAITSPMVFDSGDTPRNWAAFLALLLFPVFVLLGVGVSWCGFGFRRTRLIPVGFALPVLYGAIFWFSFS